MSQCSIVALIDSFKYKLVLSDDWVVTRVVRRIKLVVYNIEHHSEFFANLAESLQVTLVSILLHSACLELNLNELVSGINEIVSVSLD